MRLSGPLFLCCRGLISPNGSLVAGVLKQHTKGHCYNSGKVYTIAEKSYIIHTLLPGSRIRWAKRYGEPTLRTQRKKYHLLLSCCCSLRTMLLRCSVATEQRSNNTRRRYEHGTKETGGWKGALRGLVRRFCVS